MAAGIGQQVEADLQAQPAQHLAVDHRLPQQQAAPRRTVQQIGAGRFAMGRQQAGDAVFGTGAALGILAHRGQDLALGVDQGQGLDVGILGGTQQKILEGTLVPQHHLGRGGNGDVLGQGLAVAGDGFPRQVGLLLHRVGGEGEHGEHEQQGHQQRHLGTDAVGQQAEAAADGRSLVHGQGPEERKVRQKGRDERARRGRGSTCRRRAAKPRQPVFFVTICNRKV